MSAHKLDEPRLAHKRSAALTAVTTPAPPGEFIPSSGEEMESASTQVRTAFAIIKERARELKHCAETDGKRYMRSGVYRETGAIVLQCQAIERQLIPWVRN